MIKLQKNPPKLLKYKQKQFGGIFMFDMLKKYEGKIIDVNDVDELVGKEEIIDIREPYEFETGSIRTAKNIPMGKLAANPGKYLIKNKTYYIICHSGARSRHLCKMLVKDGYSLVDVAGGIASYKGSIMKKTGGNMAWAR